MANLDQFRSETRSWLEANCPVSMRKKGAAADNPYTRKKRSGDSLLWLDTMAEKGWIAPTWPTKYGGGGLSEAENAILREEMAAINAPAPLAGMSLTMIGPTLLEMGTEEQKQRHIPGITSGNIHWCQGYSEPNAGSDLANLQTKAEDKGDHFIINGSKIWTSGAMHADWMFCLVRTDPNVKKQKGISFVLFPMTDPGVSYKPIRLINGEAPFCQVFFDDVRAEKSELVGKINEGWTVGKRLLQHERSSIGGGGNHRLGTEITLLDIAKEYRSDENGKIDDPVLRLQLVQQEMDVAAFGETTRRIADEADSGITPGFATSMIKLYGSEMNKNNTELMVSIMGPQGLGSYKDTDNFTAREHIVTAAWLGNKASTIAGGCSEVQLDIIAKRILELPSA